MKKAYQIDERRAIEKFRTHLQNDHGAIQTILPLAEIAQKLRSGVTQREEEQQRRIWEAIARGLTTRGYGPRCASVSSHSRLRNPR